MYSIQLLPRVYSRFLIQETIVNILWVQTHCHYEYPWPQHVIRASGIPRGRHWAFRIKCWEPIDVETDSSNPSQITRLRCLHGSNVNVSYTVIDGSNSWYILIDLWMCPKRERREQMQTPSNGTEGERKAESTQKIHSGHARGNISSTPPTVTDRVSRSYRNKRWQQSTCRLHSSQAKVDISSTLQKSAIESLGPVEISDGQSPREIICRFRSGSTSSENLIPEGNLLLYQTKDLHKVVFFQGVKHERWNTLNHSAALWQHTGVCS